MGLRSLSPSLTRSISLSRSVMSVQQLSQRHYLREASHPTRNAILMPAMSPLMTEGSIVRWFRKEGEAFKSGDVLLEIESDIASIGVEAQNAGIIGKILAPAGTKNIPVEQAIAIVAVNRAELSRVQTRYQPKSTHIPSVQPSLQYTPILKHPESSHSPLTRVRSQTEQQQKPSPPKRPRSPTLPPLSLLAQTASPNQSTPYIRGMRTNSANTHAGASTSVYIITTTNDSQSSCSTASDAAVLRKTIVTNLSKQRAEKDYFEALL